jgi:site-specific recombinase XerD
VVLQRRRRCCSTSGAGPISDRYAREIIEGLGRLAGLDAERSEPFGPHVLRHTFGTQLVRGGVDLVTLAELMGHARLETTRLYTLPRHPC